MALAVAPGLVLGQQTPTFACVPPSVSNAAGEVIDFMASIGAPVDSPGETWQGDTLRLWLGERADGSWAAFECALFTQRQQGKGRVAEARELGGLFLFGERKVIHTAHRIDTAQEAYTRTSEIIDGCDDLTRRVRRMVPRSGGGVIELMSGALLDFRTRVRGSGRGLTNCECLVFDEALYLQPAFMDALIPTMLAAPSAQLLLTSTAPEDDDAYIMAVLDRIEDGSDPRLAGAAWVSPLGSDVDDEQVRAAANPAYGYRITSERMEDIRGRLGEAGFARECIGIWPPRKEDQGWRVVSRGDWRDAHDPGSQAADPVAFAIDTNPQRTWTSIGVAGNRADGLLHAELVDRRPGTAWVVARAIALNERWRPCAWVIDRQSPAASLIPELVEAGFEILPTTVQELGQACGAAYDAVSGVDVESRRLRWRADATPDLEVACNEAVRGAVKRDLPGGAWAWDRLTAEVDLTPWMVLTLALYGVAVKGPTWAGHYDPVANFH